MTVLLMVGPASSRWVRPAVAATGLRQLYYVPDSRGLQVGRDQEQRPPFLGRQCEWCPCQHRPVRITILAVLCLQRNAFSTQAAHFGVHRRRG